MVELQLTGVLPFERSALDIHRIEVMIEEYFQPMTTLVRNYTRPTDFAVEVEAGEAVNRSILERQVMTDLFARDARYRHQSQAWAKIALSLKRLVIDGGSPEAVIEALSYHLETLADEESAPATLPVEDPRVAQPGA